MLFKCHCSDGSNLLHSVNTMMGQFSTVHRIKARWRSQFKLLEPEEVVLGKHTYFSLVRLTM